MGKWSGRGIPPTRRKLYRLRESRRREERELRKARLELERELERQNRRLRVDKILTSAAEEEVLPTGA